LKPKKQKTKTNEFSIKSIPRKLSNNSKTPHLSNPEIALPYSLLIPKDYHHVFDALRQKKTKITLQKTSHNTTSFPAMISRFPFFS
jgi:hypothetical protein